jgi:hypothetical protein
MDDDAVRPGQLGQHGGGYGIGFAATPGLPEGGDMVNVDTETRH